MNPPEQQEKSAASCCDYPVFGIYSWLIGLAVLLVIVGGYIALRNGSPASEQTAPDVAKEDGAAGEARILSFENPKKSAHYESNTPGHGTTLAGGPINITIDFNFDLAPPSDISVKMDGKEYGAGNTLIDANKLAMRRNMEPGSPDGFYDVFYNACWPDGSCHDGKFQFAVNRTLAENFTDRRNQPEVTVKMKDIAFDPKEIRVSRGARITWIQEDSAEHFVNTETHPAHTYFPPQNSRGLKLGDTFSVVFDRPGIYPYHCSAHASVMTGAILVE